MDRWSRYPIVLLLLVSLAMLGMSACDVSGTSHTMLSDPVLSPMTFYHAYGDSITYGYLLPDPTSQAYPALVGAKYGLPVRNFGIPGDQACDLADLQIFAHGDSPTTSTRGLYSLLIGTNDVDIKGTGAYEAVFSLCQRASMAWLALPAEFKVIPTSSGVTTSGNTHYDPGTVGIPARVLDGAGASVTFSVERSGVGPVYIWYRLVDGNMGTFDYLVDGQVVGSATTATMPAIATQNGGTDSMGLARIPGVTGGAHMVKVVQTSAGGAGAGVVAVGMPPAVVPPTFPELLVGTIPSQLVGTTSGACGFTQEACLLYDADTTANIALLAGDGLNVRTFDSRRYMTGSLADMLDYVHPNAVGQVEIARGLEDAVR